MSLGERIEKDSLEAQKITRKYFVHGLDFSRSSLSDLDELADNIDIYMKGGANDENRALLVRTWGAYVGEVLVREGGVRWIESDNEHGALLEAASGAVSPHDRVCKRIDGGAEFSLVEFAKALD